MLNDVLPYDERQRCDLETISPRPWNANVRSLIDDVRWKLLTLHSADDIREFIDGLHRILRERYGSLDEDMHDRERLIGITQDFAGKRLMQLHQQPQEKN